MVEKKIIVITGANSGIGLETGKYLLSKGYKVVGIDLNSTNDLFPIIKCDITDYENLGLVFEEIESTYGPIYCLVNNAGIGISGAIEHTKINEVEKIFNINVVALINACKLIAPILRKNGGGRIINISSVAGEIPIPFQACYSATKSAVLNFSMALNLELKDFNIFVSSVLPGDTKTSFTASRLKNQIMEDENYQDRIKKSIERMEKDETNGMEPVCVSKVIHKVLRKRKPPVAKTVGLSYKLIIFLSKILPKRVMLFIVKKLYG